MIGTTIDQYRIEARLGGGGMGEVFRARDLELDRDVAIKMVRPELSDLDEVTARFRAEARTLAGLGHSNIATVFRFFAHEGTLYLVMEYISGKPFGDMLRDDGARPPAEVVHMVKQALSGLGYAHANKVVHRDIKPGNLMLDGHKTVKVLDFGIAHLLDQTRITQSGSVLGTPAYMAPEQVLGQQVDGRTDLYALGVVLYEMLTGKLPFKANSQFELMRAHLETQPRSLKELNDTVPRPLQDTIVRALAKDSDQRYQSASEFANALDVALAESQADGLVDGSADKNLGTVVQTRRSSVAVSSAAEASTVARADVEVPETEVRAPTSLEIPLPQPKIAVAATAAVLLLAGAGIWLFSGTDGNVESVTGNQPATLAAPQSTPLGAAPGGTTGWFVDEPGTASPSLDTADSESATRTVNATSQASATRSATDTIETEVAAAPAAVVTSKPKPKATKPVAPAPKPTSTASSSQTATSYSGYQVKANKVSAHERQRKGFLSRSAGYNGNFTLSVPRGGKAIQIDELIEVYQDGRQISRQLINSQARKEGRFKSKQRIPGLKELSPGSYTLRLVFENDGRRLGRHEWTLFVAG